MEAVEETHDERANVYKRINGQKIGKSGWTRRGGSIYEKSCALGTANEASYMGVDEGPNSVLGSFVVLLTRS